ncbi:MAG TPA: hypothetical protein QGG70_00810 [Candidatus Pacearchaeota archaeon]|nr:hypothetical protein [Candidatus Pacearchaeota archaeon]
MFNYKKIASVLASAVMLSSTIGFAAALSYPEPFVAGGTADVAVVWGANAAVSDLTSAIDIQQSLGSLITASTSASSAAITGEAAALFSGGTKLYINDSLNTVKNVLTESNLPTVLADTDFSGNVDTTVTNKINIGSDPKVNFKRQPTSEDDPNLAITLSTTQTKYIYNATSTFSKAINFSHADSEGEDLEVFGTSFTVGSATDTDTLVLLRSAEKLSLDSDNPSVDITIEGSIYTVELVSTSDTSATIKITDSSGNVESKEVSEAASKKINGITVAVINADETNLKLSASIIAGSDKLTLESDSSVTSGENNDVIDGTLVDFETGNPNNLTKLTVSIYAAESDLDAIQTGGTFLDPVFGTFKVDFSGFNIPTDVEDSAREDIKFAPNGDDKLDITFTDYRGHEKTFQFAKNVSGGSLMLTGDDSGRNISVFEGEKIHDEEYMVVGNEDEGRLIKLTNVKNASSGTSSDRVTFQDVFSGDTYETSWTSDGVGTIDIGGKPYTVTLEGQHTLASDTLNVSLDYPDSSGGGVAIAYPTIETSKGAKLAFYEPITIANATNWSYANALTELKFPDGDGYTSVASISAVGAPGNWSFGTGGATGIINTSLKIGSSSFTFSIGQLTYNASNWLYNDSLSITLVDVAGTANIAQAAVIIFQEKDDNNNYEAIIAEFEDGTSSDDGIGVDTIEDTWSNAASGWATTRYSDSKKTDRMNLWGSLITTDSADSDQKTGTISYPDEQVYAQIYIAENSATITPGVISGGGGGQVLIVKDSEMSSVAGKNLVVVGGSCINTAAAKILNSDSPLCGSAFTDATDVGATQYLIKTVQSPWSADKVAMLVAGYEAADTVNAVKKAMEGATTDADTEQVYPIVSA